ncbi:MAG TPA: glycosyltransferase, partial [Thermoplasmata archaeon]|nr:glycosyltransferase [Thermoplasmata archaeon]
MNNVGGPLGMDRVPVSVGICAFNEQRQVGRALKSLLEQEIPEGFVLSEILVVASGCTDGTEAVVASWAKADSRVVLVRQPIREGKASAINVFLAQARGEVLVLLNADARLRTGSLKRLLDPFARDPGFQIACGLPVPETDGSPLVRRFAEVQWGLHNRALETLGRLGLPNHCCDEFLAMRKGFVDSIPPEVINDGAYLAVVAEQHGCAVHVCTDALVTVEIPRTLRGALMQRRRVLRGHRQIRGLLA